MRVYVPASDDAARKRVKDIVTDSNTAHLHTSRTKNGLVCYKTLGTKDVPVRKVLAAGATCVMAK